MAKTIYYLVLEVIENKGEKDLVWGAHAPDMRFDSVIGKKTRCCFNISAADEEKRIEQGVVYCLANRIPKLLSFQP